jgi:hypothetical protein
LLGLKRGLGNKSLTVAVPLDSNLEPIWLNLLTIWALKVENTPMRVGETSLAREVSQNKEDI